MRFLALALIPLLISCGDGGPSGPSPDPVTVSTSSLPEGSVGVAYSAALAASGGTGSYGWSVTSGSLPPGLNLAAGGAITGTPNAAGTSNFTVRATSGKLSGTRALSIAVQPPAVTITTSALADGTAGVAYSQTLAASGGTGAYTWTIASGALPPGLTLAASGSISGTPSAGGTSNFTVQATSGSQSATRAFTISVAFPAVVVNTATLPDGVVGTAYSQTLGASGGTGSYTWAVSGGTLPAGFTLSPAGVLAGTPTAAGTTSFTVQATSGTQSATRPLTITVQLPPVVITTTMLADGAVGEAYSQTLSATGGNGTFTWALASGALPPGVALSAAGVLSGTPTAAGIATFAVRASSGGINSVAPLTITVQPPPVVIGATDPPPAVQGIAYSHALTATGGTGSYTWALAAGSLPAGISLSAGGVLSGTPTAQGSTTFTVQATSGARTATRELTFTVQAPNLVITTTSLPNGANGEPYSQALTASGGTGVYNWTLLTGTLPAGLTLSPAGVISGTPTGSGTSNFTVRVTSGTQEVGKALSITITTTIPNVTIVTSTLPGGNIGESYSATLVASGGTGSYSWSVTSGDLPAGLNLAANGQFSGTATGAPGTANFTVQVTSGTKTATRSLSITIGAPLPEVTITTTSPLPDAMVGAAYSQQLQATGGTGTFSWARTAGTLPAGLSLSSSGAITGTPQASAVGTANFTVRATSGSKQATAVFDLTVEPAALTITTSTLPSGMVTVPYSRTLAATGGTGGYVWSITDGTLPVGLALNAASGQITGTPTTAATANFTVQVASGALTATRALAITIAAVPAVNITTTSLTDATQGTPYSRALQATGGTGTYTWSISAGALPAGLTLSGNTISGTPTTAGTANFTVRVVSGDKNDEQALSIVVQPAGPAYQMFLNVGNNPTASVNRGAQISIPLNVDLTQQGTENLATITVRVDWDATRFDFVNAPAGNWVDKDGSFASVTINTSTSALGYITMTGYVTEPDLTLTSFILRTVNLTAKAGAPTGTTPVTATISDTANKDAGAVTVTPRNLTVTINL